MKPRNKVTIATVSNSGVWSKRTQKSAVYLDVTNGNSFIQFAAQQQHDKDDALVNITINGTIYPANTERLEMGLKMPPVVSFPNGFTSWYETFFEITEYLLTTVLHDGFYSQHIQNEAGRAALQETAMEWTEAFEDQHRGIEWGVGDAPDWHETIEMWCSQINTYHMNRVKKG